MSHHRVYIYILNILNINSGLGQWEERGEAGRGVAAAGVPAGLLHDLGAVVAAHLAEGLVAVHDGVVHDLRVRQQEAAVCCTNHKYTLSNSQRLAPANDKHAVNCHMG